MYLFQYINILSKNSKKKKDFFACLIIAMAGMFLGMVVHIMKPFFHYFLLFFNVIIQSIMQIISFSSESTSFEGFAECYNIIQKISADLNNSALEIVITFIILMMLTFLMVYSINIRRAWLMLIVILLEFVINSLMFQEVKFLIILTVIVLLMMQGLIPIGSVSYFKVIQYVAYLPDIYKREERKEPSARKILFKILLILLLGAAFAYVMNYGLPYLSKKVSFLLFVAILILVWMNQCADLTIKIIRKIFSYSIIAIFVLLDNNSFDIDGLSPILALVSIFFAIERVITLAKELAKRVENKSLLFLCDEINDCEALLEQRLEIPIEVVEKLPEDMLIRQILINFKLSFFSKALEMIAIYKSQKFNKQTYIIYGIEFEILFAKGDITIEEAEEKLEEIFLQQNNGIKFYPLNCNYACILFLNDRGYQKIIDLLEDSWLLLDDDMKFTLYYAFIKQGKSKAAEEVKKEISNFQDVELKNIENRREYLLSKEDIR